LKNRSDASVVDAAIGEAVAAGKVWLVSGPASLLAEPIPVGVLTATAKLRVPPASVSATATLPENLPDAWSGSNILRNRLALSTGRGSKSAVFKTLLPGAVLVIALPYTWLEEFTKKEDGFNTVRHDSCDSYPRRSSASRSGYVATHGGRPARR
jgi:hypothetical protein